VIGLGLAALIAGCVTAVVRSDRDQREEELSNDADELLNLIITSYGSPALWLQELSSDTSGMDTYLDGRSALVRVITMDGDGLEIYLPDRETFQDHQSEDSMTRNKTISVALEDGRIRPGELEVTLNG